MSDIKITLTKSAPIEDEPIRIPGTGSLTLLSSSDNVVAGGNNYGLTIGTSAIVLIVAMLYIAAIKSKKRSRGVRFGAHRSHNHKVYYTATKTKAVLSLSTILLIAAVLIPIASQHLNNNDDFVLATSEVLSIITNPIEVSVGLTDSDTITAALSEVSVASATEAESTAISIEHEDGSVEGNICVGDAVCNWELKVGETYNISATLAEGYEFDAWTDSAGNGVFGDASSAETTYTVNSATTITPSGRLVIIDIECNPNASTISEVVCMQDIRNGDRAAIFGSMTEGVAYQFYDIRDERQYNIAKLPDGNLWMLDNLALDIVSVSLDNLLGETNASNTTLGYLKNGGGTTSDQYANEAVANWTGKEASTSSPLIETGSIDVIPANPDLGAGNHKVGVYYNYCAATAGAYCYEDDSLRHDETTANPVEDICPAGWRLPSGDNDGEYKVLAEAITGKPMETTYYKDDDAVLIRTALSLPLSGSVRALDNTVISQGSFGEWWSSSRWVGTDHMYSSMSSSTFFYPSRSTTGRETGYTIRCMSSL